MSILIFIVCAEAYNPDEEEDDAESRVCSLLNKFKLLLYWIRKIIIEKVLTVIEVSRRYNGIILAISCLNLISDSLLLFQVLLNYFYPESPS